MWPTNLIIVVMRRGALNIEAVEKRLFQNRVRACSSMGSRIYVNYGTSILYGLETHAIGKVPPNGMPQHPIGDD